MSVTSKEIIPRLMCWRLTTVGPAQESRMGMDGWVVYLFGLGSSLPQIFLIFLAQLLSRAYFSSGEWWDIFIRLHNRNKRHQATLCKPLWQFEFGFGTVSLSNIGIDFSYHTHVFIVVTSPSHSSSEFVLNMSL